jgi:hypothetical protein
VGRSRDRAERSDVLEGSAENISVRIEGNSACGATFTINSVTLHYTPRRIIR